VRSIDRVVYRKSGKPFRKQPGVLLKFGVNTYGYDQVQLNHSGKSVYPLVSRLVAFAFIENPHCKPEVNHKDPRNKHNNSVDNLEWVTRIENLEHSYAAGLKRIGVMNGNAKLTKDKVVTIRREYAAGGVSYKSIAKRYGVDKSLIGLVVRHKIWKHV